MRNLPSFCQMAKCYLENSTIYSSSPVIQKIVTKVVTKFARSSNLNQRVPEFNS